MKKVFSIAALVIFGAVLGLLATHSFIAAPAELPEQGTPLPAPLPPELVGLVRFNGAGDGNWSKPGADPFKGDVSSALAAMGMHEPMRTSMAIRIRDNKYEDTVCATKYSILSRKTHQPYAPGMAMTFGTNKIVYNQVANFEGEQCGRLFVIENFHIWIPDVCGNVTRLMPWLESNDYDNSGRPNVLPGVPYLGPGLAGWARRYAHRTWGWYAGPAGGIGNRRGQPYQPIPEGGGLAGSDTHSVPEPGTMALVFIGFLAVLNSRRFPWIRNPRRTTTR